MDQYDHMQEQKRRILERENTAVFDAAVAALKVGAPGLSETTREGIARNIALRVLGNATSKG